MNFLRNSGLLILSLSILSSFAAPTEYQRKKAAKKYATYKSTRAKVKKDEKTTKKVTKKHEPTAVRRAAVKRTRKAPVKAEPTKVRETYTKAVAQKTAPKRQEESTLQKIGDYLGLGQTTKPLTRALTGTHVVHHRGPDGFFENHSFPSDWKGGFVGRWEGGKYRFGGRELPWWKEKFPKYYENVVRPEFIKAGGIIKK